MVAFTGMRTQGSQVRIDPLGDNENRILAVLNRTGSLRAKLLISRILYDGKNVPIRLQHIAPQAFS
jgi:hypothetical protein